MHIYNIQGRNGRRFSPILCLRFGSNSAHSEPNITSKSCQKRYFHEICLFGRAFKVQNRTKFRPNRIWWNEAFPVFLVPFNTIWPPKRHEELEISSTVNNRNTIPVYKSQTYAYKPHFMWIWGELAKNIIVSKNATFNKYQHWCFLSFIIKMLCV